MHARYQGKAVHSSGQPGRISDARRQAILSRTLQSGSRTVNIAEGGTINGVEQSVMSADTEYDAGTTLDVS